MNLWADLLADRHATITVHEPSGLPLIRVHYRSLIDSPD